jgi:hypothetical protein
MTAITHDLAYEWYVYRGTNLETTREFCELLTKKEYVHKSEIPEILKGKIDGHQCRIYDKTGLPYGMKEGTNAENFQANCGGWNCGHALIPVPEKDVPEGVRNKIAQKKIHEQNTKSRQSVLEHAKHEIIGQSLYRKELNATIEFTKRGIKEALNQRHEKYLEKNEAIKDMVTMLKKAPFIESAINKKPEKKPNILKYHYFSIEIAGMPSQIVVEENKQGKFIFHSITKQKTK